MRKGPPRASNERPALRRLAVLFAALVAVVPSPSVAHSHQVARTDHEASKAVEDFYAARRGEPLWFGRDAGSAPEELLKLLGTAEVDGVSKDQFDLGLILLSVREAAAGEPSAVKRAELKLSQAFIDYARALQRDPKVGVVYVDRDLQPSPSSPEELLRVAAEAPSLTGFVRNLGWMNPLYGQLRGALVGSNISDRDRQRLSLNLERARALPSSAERYVLVNTANQRLYMYEKGKIVDEMKIVAGRADAQTPLLNAYIRFAVLNPYWNVPADLTARLAPKIIRGGAAYLKQQGYEVVSDFSDRPQILDPRTVDWKAVAAGQRNVQLRQYPGPANSMGRIKFMFPNPQGVWLHDTPTVELFRKDVRLDSAGCIRLEDAWRLGSWLFKRSLGPQSSEPEQRLELPEPVPVYITYLTAIPSAPSFHFVEDVYRRDAPPLQSS